MEAVRAAGATLAGGSRLRRGAAAGAGAERARPDAHLGMDVSTVALARARRHLHWRHAARRRRARIEIAQGSLLYRDKRLAGFDAAALVEVDRASGSAAAGRDGARGLRACPPAPRDRDDAEPRVQRPLGGAGHGDACATAITASSGRAPSARPGPSASPRAYGYAMAWQEIGPADEALGAPSQMVIFDRQDGDAEMHAQRHETTENGKEATSSERGGRMSEASDDARRRGDARRASRHRDPGAVPGRR